MTTSAQRVYMCSPDGKMIVGFDDLNVVGAVALDHGEGADLVDTSALDLALGRNRPTPVELRQRAGSTP